MALNIETLNEELFSGFKDILTDRHKSTDETESVEDSISAVAQQLADVVSKATDNYIKSGDIIIKATNVTVMSTSPGTPAAVTPGAQPAKVE